MGARLIWRKFRAIPVSIHRALTGDSPNHGWASHCKTTRHPGDWAATGSLLPHPVRGRTYELREIINALHYLVR